MPSTVNCLHFVSYTSKVRFECVFPGEVYQLLTETVVRWANSLARVCFTGNYMFVIKVIDIFHGAIRGFRLLK